MSSYRGGYFGPEREEIENALANGSLHGVISTSALELGIDIGGLDACILCGYPGTVMQTKQRAGRAGRGFKESIVILVASPNALDQYYIRHPREFFGKVSEEAILNPENPYILAGHILCAASEIPISEKDKVFFGDKTQEVIEVIASNGLIVEMDNKYRSIDRYPHKEVFIRGVDWSTDYALYDVTNGKKKEIEKRTERSFVFREAFVDAVYLHRGTSYMVSEIDHEKREVYMEKTITNYYTKAL
ncbi:MAG: helicase-related protein, partial [Methanosarcinales archaeon]